MPLHDTTTALDQAAARRKVNATSSDVIMDAAECEYTPTTLGDWGGSDPGVLSDALDYLASTGGGGGGNVSSTLQFTADNRIVRTDRPSTDNRSIQISLATLNDAGVLTLDDGSGNTWSFDPAGAAPLIGVAGTISATVFSVTASGITMNSPIRTDGSAFIDIKAIDTNAAGSTIKLRNGITTAKTTVQVGNDAAGGTGIVSLDTIKETRANGTISMTFAGTGGFNVTFNKATEQFLAISNTGGGTGSLSVTGQVLTGSVTSGSTLTLTSTGSNNIVLAPGSTGVVSLGTDKKLTFRSASNYVYSNATGELTIAASTKVTINKLEPRYRQIRVPFFIKAPEAGDIVPVYVAGHSGAGLKQPYAKILRIAHNTITTSSTLTFQAYIRTASDMTSGGTGVFASAKSSSTTYAEETTFSADEIDSSADASADEALVIEIASIGGTAPSYFHGWVTVELQD